MCKADLPNVSHACSIGLSLGCKVGIQCECGLYVVLIKHHHNMCSVWLGIAILENKLSSNRIKPKLYDYRFQYIVDVAS